MRRLDKNLTISVLHFAAAAAISLCWLFLSGCALDFAEQRQISGSELNRVLDHYPRITATKTIRVKDITFHFVPDRSHFDYKPYRDPEMGVLAYTDLERREIWVVGRIYKGGIVCGPTTIAWEVWNLLHFIDPAIIDPEEDL